MLSKTIFGEMTAWMDKTRRNELDEELSMARLPSVQLIKLKIRVGGPVQVLTQWFACNFRFDYHFLDLSFNPIRSQSFPVGKTRVLSQ